MVPFFDYFAAVTESNLTANERLTALAIARHVGNNGMGCYAKVETLARETGLSSRTIIRATSTLVNEKWLVQTHHGRGGSSKMANSYDTNIPVPDESMCQPVTLDDDSQGSMCQPVTLQSDTVPVQSDTVSISKCHSGVTTATRTVPVTSHANDVSKSPPPVVEADSSDDELQRKLARAWLQEHLTDGQQHEQQQVFSAGRESGFSENMIKDAAVDLAILRDSVALEESADVNYLGPRPRRQQVWRLPMAA